MTRIIYFDSLRAYCALWVACVHLARMLVLHDTYWVPSSEYAVGIFFILSGYVITTLIEHQQESYSTFLFRRFCRLAPIFAFFCIVYLLHVEFIVQSLSKLDLTQYPVYGVIPYYVSGRDQWYLHLPAHIMMVHGLLDPWLPGSSKAIIPPGWTMSVEWQFYIVVPLILFWLRHKRFILLVTFCLAAVALQFRPFNAVLFTDYLFDFMAGILTCLYLHRQPECLKTQNATVLLILGVVTFAGINKDELALWCGFLWFAYGSTGKILKTIFEFLFNNRAIGFMGRISYSFYLAHLLAIFYVIPIVARSINPISEPLTFFALAMPLALCLAIAFSAVTYTVIEKPIIAWAKNILAHRV